MNLVNCLVSLLNSPWATLLPLVLIPAVTVILLRCLLIFVQSWIKGKKSKTTLTILTQAFEQYLTMILLSLNQPSATAASEDDFPKDSSQEELQLPELQLPELQLPELPTQLHELILQLKEVMDNHA